MSDILTGSSNTSLSGSSSSSQDAPAASPAESTDTTQGNGQKDGIAETSQSDASETLPVETTETTPEVDADGKETVPVEAAALDPEIEAFARGKGIDLSEVQKSPVIQNILKSSREAEAEMNRLRNEVTRLNESRIAGTPDQQSANGNQVAPDISPIAEVKQLYKDAIAAECYRNGVNSEAELRAQFPDVFSQLHNMYLEERADATEKEFEWREGKKARELEVEERERQAIGFVQGIKTTASENMNEFRANVKNFDENLVRSGASQVVGLIADAMGVTTDYLHADRRVSTFIAKASEAIMALESGSYKKKLYAEWEAARNKQQSAEIPSGSSDGNIDAFAAHAHNVGASIL